MGIPPDGRRTLSWLGPGGSARSPWLAWAGSSLALAAALGLRWGLDPVLEDQLPLAPLFGAVAAAMWLGGVPTAAAVAGLGYLASAYLFIEPRGQLGPVTSGHAARLAVYLFTSALIIGFGRALRSAQLRAADRRAILEVTLSSIGDGVITTDVEGRVTYLNAVSEALTGWKLRDAVGLPLERVFRIVDEGTREPVENPVERALREGSIVGLANHTLLIRKDDSECPIDDSAAPIRGERGEVSGCVLIFRDVSAQRAVAREREGQLLSARLLASIVESSDDAIISKSLQGVIQSWNAGAERLFGHSAEQAIGRHITLVIPPERVAEEDQIIATLAQGKRVEHFETERVRADGRRIWVSLTISPIKDEAGNVIGASKIARDVTRQRQAEQRERELLTEAAEANAKFQAFFEQGALFAGILELDGTLREVNRLAWEGCGFAREQTTGIKFWEGPWWSPDPELAARVRAATERAAEGTHFRGELPYYVADGSRRIADVGIQPIRDAEGRVLFLAPTGTDITERKRAEADRERFATLVETSTDFIGICDLSGVPIFVNRAGLERVGLESIEDARSRSVADFFFPEDRARILDEFFPQVLARGHGEIEVRFRHFRTGEARWMAYKVLALRDASGHPTALATVSQDVSERKRLTDDLHRLAADLSEADRRKDEFLATLAHELRNPLAPLVSMLEVLKRGGDDPDTVERARATMERQLGQLVRLVDDLLDLNRITYNRLELRPTPVTLASVLQHAVEASRPFVEAAGHRLSVELPEAPLYVHGDPVRLAQVFGNLLHNSCKYTPPGGSIGLRADRDGNDARVTVSDTGAGIPPEVLDRIFDMFVQVDRSLERSQGGLGIGLTLVKRLVLMHGGSIEAHSAGEGQGSEFTVRLPLLAGVAPGAEERTDAAEKRPSGHRILVVDDNEDAAESLAMLLRLWGHDTATAYDGRAGLEAAERGRPDVVLLDLGLPQLGGHEVCRRIRQQPWGRDTLIVALTGWGQAEDRRRTQEAGFDGHLVKPVDHAALAELLRALPRD